MTSLMSSDWTEQLNAADSVTMLLDLSKAHALNGGVVGMKICALIDAHDLAGLVNFELHQDAPDWDVLQLAECRQALAFFEKADFLDLGIDKESVAYDKFLKAEASCKLANALFCTLHSGSHHGSDPLTGDQLDASTVSILYAARKRIRKILGRAPSLSDLGLRFGPGATTSVKKKDATYQTKMAGGFKCSMDLYVSGLLPSLIREVPHWSAALDPEYTIDDEGWLVEHVAVDITSGRLEFVPKSAKTHRAIVVEPVLNTFVQSGIGDFMASRLRSIGLDIKDQNLNACYAREGSVTDLISTIDLSSASDTIARELVKFMLPDDWYALLNATRTSEVSYKGSFIALEKFSSMGNGFTFPLETLLFYALTLSSCSSEGLAEAPVRTYGDDIICPSRDAANVIRVLQICGFSVNSEKSFVSGPFRESCGHDYYNGIDVRPVYVKHRLNCASLFVLHNHYARSYQKEYADSVLAHIPPPLAIFGPDGYGDGHLLGEWLPRKKKQHLSCGYGGSLFDTFSLIGRKAISSFPGDWVSPLYSIYRKGISKLHPALAGLYETTPVEFDGKRPVWTLPGSDKGYKRVSIYTLSS